MHPSSSKLPDEEGAVRSVLTPGCGLHGDCKSTPEGKKCGKKAFRLVVHIGKYSKVTLCDISPRFDQYRQDGCYKLTRGVQDHAVQVGALLQVRGEGWCSREANLSSWLPRWI